METREMPNGRSREVPGRTRHKFVLFLILLFLAGAAAAQNASDAKAVCDQVGTISQTLANITGLKLLHPVPCDSISKEQVNQFLKERLKKESNPKEIRAEELVLKKLGLVPADFDLAKTVVDLLTEQAAAFYDYNRRKLFIGESVPAATLEPVLAHELSHALADQHFSLARYVKGGRKNDDGAAARLAVMEGQATWLMSEFIARKLGQSLEKSPQLVSAMSAMGQVAAGDFPVFENAPLYFRQSLIFPYTQGMLFQNALVQRLGHGGFTEPFLTAPVSTQQIIHPDKYFSSVKPVDPPLPRVRLPGYKSLVRGSLGEMDHSILIEQFAGKDTAAEIAPHWRGAAIEVRENEKAGRSVLLYVAQWDSEDSARRYFQFYRQALAKKWKAIRIENDGANLLSGEGDDGRFEVRLAGTVFTSVEGLPPGID